jgi:NitT/TauT family transport system permease protein
MTGVNAMRQINRHPQQGMRLMLLLLPFVLLIAAWFIGSAIRLESNPQDKLIGLAVSALIGLSIGIVAGVFPLYRAALSPLMTVVSMVPPLAILPVLFIVFGLDELSKVMLIVIGITPMLARDLEQRAREIPAELFIKAQTLGANSWTVVLRVVLPQLLSRLITSLRLLLGSAWLFLISAEAISATAGLGYRIFLVRRYMAMDVIIPYVIWITLLAWLMDLGLRQLHKVCFPWAEGGRT